ncbi:MAG TPA: NAD-dependent epimerase/dehydratase family protein [Candidatus Binataceae bacterium]|nr:NAD-dependent epimerase/dehydratase family protein [Candidatus Binataceae bacterium]
MAILVTGGAGFIGSHTVDALVARGEEVAVLDNLSSGKRANLNPRARFYHADLREPAALATVLERERPAVIFHFAAQMDVRRSVADPAFDAQVNLVGMLHLMEAARGQGLKRIIFSSTGGAIYGEQLRFPCDETHPCRPLSPYGIAKLATEHYLEFYRLEYGIDFTALRYANVYGPRQDPHGEAGVVAIFCGRLLAGLPCTIYGDGAQTRDYVYVGDIVRANLAALDHSASGSFNVGTAVETDVNGLYAMAAAIVRSSAVALRAPARPGEQRRSVIDAGRARRELGWEPQTSLAEGLRQTLEYFRGRSPVPGSAARS